jgi:hypothetical protein
VNQATTLAHCGNLSGDRKIGQFWERQLCIMAAQLGRVFSPNQLRRDGAAAAYYLENGKYHTMTLPDVTIWSDPGEHHEIKHKNPTNRTPRCFGLEAYRFDALIWFWHTTNQRVFYTIHNHDLSGGRNATENNLAHWLTVDVALLEGTMSSAFGNSYVNGSKKRVKVHYWNAAMWKPLGEQWRVSQK